MASTAKAPSVKSVCEDNILKGRKMGVVMNNLRKKFPEKDEATLEKSVKYYASAMQRAGTITEEAKAMYVGGRGKPAAAAKPAKAGKSGKTKASKSDKPAKATRGKKAAAGAKADKPAKAGKKTSARSKAKKS